jgi:MFS family permease
VNNDQLTEQPKPTQKLWNFNFTMVWFGQLVSVMGDFIYGIVLGFWILQKTGSTAIMGGLMSASSLPRIILSPFAGVIVDRINRKLILVLTDAVRGIFIIAIAIAALTNLLQIWMVFVAGIIISLGSAFFIPAGGSVIPDIVPTEKLIKANSAFSIVQTGSGIVGNAAGGFLFQILGAPLMFLVNGISYIVGAIATFVIKIPKVIHKHESFHFFSDLKTGLRFVWQYRGIRNLMIVASALNFFAVMAIMLFLPLFQKTPKLGAGLYGIFMSCVMAGLFVGFLLTSIFHFPYHRRFFFFLLCGITSMTAAIFIPIWLFFPLMVVLAFIVGLGNAILNSFIQATMGIATPQDMRGKVFSLIGTIAGGLMPIAFALGGVLAEFISIRILISSAFFITLLVHSSMIFSKPIKQLINYNPESDTIEKFR